MFDFFDKPPKELLGIDIGSKQIKMVELEREKGRKPVLKNYALILVKDVNIREMSIDSIVGILKQAVARAKIKTEDTVMSLPAFSVFLTPINMPNMPENEEELDQLVRLEARKYIPVPLEEVNLGWSRLDKEILLVTVSKDIVYRYSQIAKDVGLELKALEAETFSLARSLASGVKELIAVVDFGARSTNVSLAEDGKVRMNRTLEKPSIEQIKSIIGSATQKIILTGGRIDQTLVAGFSNCQIGNPWQNVVYPKELEQILIGLSPSFAVAIGLALRDFNG